jgi:hypothetical protein
MISSVAMASLIFGRDIFLLGMRGPVSIGLADVLSFRWRRTMSFSIPEISQDLEEMKLYLPRMIFLE